MNSTNIDFSLFLRPQVTVRPTSLKTEYRWDYASALMFARSISNEETHIIERKFTYFANPHPSISNKDMESILFAIGHEHEEHAETRSVCITLTTPIIVDRGDKNTSVTITSLQIKGIVFNSNQLTDGYGGAGWPREIYHSNSAGQLGAYLAPKDCAIGCCLTAEALNEYLMATSCWELLETTEIQSVYPIGWGIFDIASKAPQKYGFVVLGLPSLIPGREQVYLNTATRAVRDGDLESFMKLITLRGNAMHELNSRGIVSPGRHFGNFSLDLSGKAFLHDLGPTPSLIYEHLQSDDQYAAETFSQLIYSITPRKVCIPVPPEYSHARTVLTHNYHQFLHKTLLAYYRTNEVEAFNANEVQDAFFDVLSRPISESKKPFAGFHLRMVRLWLSSNPSIINRTSFTSRYAIKARK